jgi:hypothetical protein
MALVEQRLARDKGGGKVLDKGDNSGGDSGVNQFSRHASSRVILESGRRGYTGKRQLQQ